MSFIQTQRVWKYRCGLSQHDSAQGRQIQNLYFLILSTTTKASIIQMGFCLLFCNLLISDSSCYQDIHLSFLYGELQILNFLAALVYFKILKLKTLDKTEFLFDKKYPK